MLRAAVAACLAALLLASVAAAVCAAAPAAVPSPSPVPAAAASPLPIGRTAARPALLPALPDRAPPQANVDAGELIGGGALRLGDALGALPGLSAIGQGSSVSDDLFVSLHGFKPTETLTLLDGHPVGILGVSPDMDAGFNYQDSPLFALRGATVTYGAGPATASSFDGLAGSIDIETLAPAGAPRTTLIFGRGGQATASSALQATGTAGAVGYAFAYSVQGTSGNFSPQTIAQTGLRAADFTTPTLAALTYPVSANADLRDALGTLRFPLGRATLLQLTTLSATSWIDKTGVDDNDFYPFAFELDRAQRNVGGPLVPGGAHCASSLVPVIDDARPDPAQPACITPRTFAADASGPAGGGPGAFQTVRRADEDLRITSRMGPHRLTFDGFLGAETTALDRPASFVQGPSDDAVTRYASGGFIARDDVAFGKVSVGAGISWERQHATFDDTFGANTSGAALTASQATIAEGNAFVESTIAPTEALTFGANLLFKRFDALGRDALDSQFSAVYRPTPADALRLIAGASTQEPAGLARLGAPAFTAAGDLDPGNCSTFTIGTASNPDVSTERSADLQASYGHHFGSIAAAGVTAFVTSVSGQIFGAGAPLGTIAGITAGSPELAGFYDRVRSICPAAYGGSTDAQIFDALVLEAPINAAHALTRGLEFAGSVALVRALTLSGTYAVDSAQRLDLPASVLAIPSNVTLVNGAQIAGIPVHQGSASLAYVNRRGLSAALNAFYQGPNNRFNLPGFAYADASAAIVLGAGRRIDIGLRNAFNSHADIYGRVGLGLFQPENAFGTDGSALEQATERYGLSPATIVVTLTQRVGRERQ